MRTMIDILVLRYRIDREWGKEKMKLEKNAPSPADT